MATVLLTLAFLSSFLVSSSGVGSATMQGTESPWPDASTGTERKMLIQSIIRAAVPTAPLPKPDSDPITKSPAPTSAPSQPTPDPVTGHQESPDPSPGHQELIDGMTPQERAMRIAILRRQLQDQLGLTELPPASSEKSLRSLPQPIKKRLIKHLPPQQEFEHYEQPGSEIKEVLSFAENDMDGCPAPGYCFLFRLVRDIHGKPIKSIHLWMYLTPSGNTNRSPVRRITVWLLRTVDSGIVRKQLATKMVSKKEGWFHLELPQDKHDWGSLEHRLQLSNVAVDFPLSPSSITPDEVSHLPPPISLARDQLPILTVTVDEDQRHRRVRRQAPNPCPPAPDNCCLQYFQVNMTEVLGHMVVFPTTLFANFCRGGCQRVANFASLHATVMRDRALIEPDQNLKADMLPCCVPRSYAAPTSMLYESTNGTVVRIDVDKISAESCICT